MEKNENSLLDNGKKAKKIKKYFRNVQGITLVALVITIVVLLILAGVTIGIMNTDGGIFNKAEQTTEEQNIQKYLETFNIAKMNVIAKNTGKITQDMFIEEVENSHIIKEHGIEKNEDGNYQMTSEEGYVFVVTERGDRDIEINYIGNVGKTLQRAKIQMSGKILNSKEQITAIVTLPDTAEIQKCKWIYTVQEEKIGTDASYYENTFTQTIEELSFMSDVEKTYYLHVLIEDSNGNKSETISKPVIPTRCISTKNINKIDISKIEEFVDKTNLIWNSSNENIVEVTQEGDITGKQEGEAIITIKADDIEKQYKVIVKDVLYLYNNGDACKDVTSGWDYIGGRYYPEKSYAKLQADHIEYYYGGYIATYLKNINIKDYNYINIEMEETAYRNVWTSMQIFFYDELGEYSNPDGGWANYTKEYRLHWFYEQSTAGKRNIYSENIEELKTTTKAISVICGEGKDWKGYSISLSVEKLGE